MSRRHFAMRFPIAILALAALSWTSRASAEVLGVSGTSFTLTAKADRLSTPDGHSIYFWGFSTPASNGGRTQYPGPTLIIPSPGMVSITVVNSLPAQLNQRVSLAIGGLGVTASCAVAPCFDGPITKEAGQGGSVTYTFNASRPGTFLYNSASRPDLQVEMGLAGAMIVQPGTTTQAYGDTAPADQTGNPSGSQFDREYLFFLSEMDSEIHDLIEEQGVQAADDSGRLSYYWPNYWFINGRNAPDTMAEPGRLCPDPLSTLANPLPPVVCGRFATQPYSAFPKVHPGERLLMRVVGGGHEMHPFHHHGQHARVIGVDGFPLETAPGSHFDLSHEVFTIQSLPGQTIDAIFRWTGKGLGWDVYGGDTNPNHPAGSCGAASSVDAEGLDAISHEFCADHNKAIPVILPDLLNLDRIGEFYSGSPFLGTMGLMTPGSGGLNPDAGYTYMWHSHNEKEITNFDIFPGGMMTMLMIVPPGVPIE
jgi:manganese oxidase